MRIVLGSLICFCMSACVLSPGCTPPSQKAAERAMSIYSAQERALVSGETKQDLALANLAKQYAVDLGVAEARTAASNASPEGAQAALEKAVNRFEKINWLLIELEKNQSLLRITKFYIWQQRGALDVFLEDWQKAKEQVESEEVPQPTSTPS